MFKGNTANLLHHCTPDLAESRCLRKRLRDATCTLCIDSCNFQALCLDGGAVTVNKSQCLGCGVCTAACPADAFTFAAFDLNQDLNTAADFKDIVITCHSCNRKFEKELRVPCVGVFPAEALLFLGLKCRGDVYFNISECSECDRSAVSVRFSSLLEKVQKLAGHLFTTRLMAIREWASLPVMRQENRRTFLLSLRSDVSGLVKERLEVKKLLQTGTVQRQRRYIPGKISLLRRIFAIRSDNLDELLHICTPDVSVSAACTLCPRCTGICPTGAIKVIKRNQVKSLSFDRTLCTGCNLCAEFCKETALSMTRPPLHLGDRA